MSKGKLFLFENGMQVSKIVLKHIFNLDFKNKYMKDA